jgi:hypothetical protein
MADDIADLHARLTRLVGQVDGLQATLDALHEDAPTPAGPQPVPASPPFILRLPDGPYETELAALVNWVEHILIPVYGREVSQGAPWCARWWEHQEAVARLHACWLAWQGLTDPATGGVTGPSTWHRDHLDPALRELRSPTGPFAACMTLPDIVNHTPLAEPPVEAYHRPGDPAAPASP